MHGHIGCVMDGTRVCKICRERFETDGMEKTYVGWVCAQGYGCKKAKCAAINRGGNPCTASGRFRRIGHDGTAIDLCGDHARGFDEDAQARGSKHATLRVRHGVPYT